MHQPDQAPDPLPQSAKADRRPLYLRMYFQAHLTELVQTVGYRDWQPEDLLRQVQPLFERYGKETVKLAADEILAFDRSQSPTVVRLTDDARQLAIGLLGRPNGDSQPVLEAAADEPDEYSPDSQEPDMTNASPPDSFAGYSPVNATRAVVIRELLAWMDRSDQDYFLMKDAAAEDWSKVDPRIVDVVARRPGDHRLLAVRKSLTKAQAASLAAAAQAMNCRAARVWPDKGPSGQWWWRSYRLEVANGLTQQPEPTSTT